MNAPLTPAELEEKRLRNRVRDGLQSDEAMIRLMDGMFGRKNYTYDPEVDVWVAVDRDHAGPGRGFILVGRGGDWRRTVISGSALQ
jgi:hypothetical protein